MFEMLARMAGHPGLPRLGNQLRCLRL